MINFQRSSARMTTQHPDKHVRRNHARIPADQLVGREVSFSTNGLQSLKGASVFNLKIINIDLKHETKQNESAAISFQRIFSLQRVSIRLNYENSANQLTI